MVNEKIELEGKLLGYKLKSFPQEFDLRIHSNMRDEVEDYHYLELRIFDPSKDQSQLDAFTQISGRILQTFWENFLRERIEGYHGQTKVEIIKLNCAIERCSTSFQWGVIQEYSKIDLVDLSKEEKDPTLPYSSLVKRIEELERLVKGEKVEVEE